MKWVAAAIAFACAVLAWALHDLERTLSRASQLEEDDAVE